MRGIIYILICAAAIGCSRTAAPTTGGSTESAQQTEEQDLQALQGSWRVVRGLDRGKPVPENELQGVEFEFQGEKIIGRENRKEDFRDPFKLDITQKPRVMRVSTGEQERPVVDFIYEVNGDTLKLAFTKRLDDKRPTSFELEPGADVQLFYLERKK